MPIFFFIAISSALSFSFISVQPSDERMVLVDSRELSCSGRPSLALLMYSKNHPTLAYWLVFINYMWHKKLGFVLAARLLLKHQRKEMLGLPSTLDDPRYSLS